MEPALGAWFSGRVLKVEMVLGSREIVRVWFSSLERETEKFVLTVYILFCRLSEPVASGCKVLSNSEKTSFEILSFEWSRLKAAVLCSS